MKNYESFKDYFEKNKLSSVDVSSEEYVRVQDKFNEILEISQVKLSTQQAGIAAALYLRGTKYLFTSTEYAVAGHTEESKILLRNVIELLILGVLIAEKTDVFDLWKECHQIRVKNTDDQHSVNMEEVIDSKFNVSNIRSKHIKFLSETTETSHLYDVWKHFSNRYSHENLYNIAVRVESNSERTEVYIGDGFDSSTRRIPQTLSLISDVANDIMTLFKRLSVEINGNKWGQPPFN